MSAGTIFCMSGDELIMDDSSFIGPIDPQVISKEGRFVPAQAIFKLIEYINQRGMEHLKRKEPVDWTDVQLLGSIDAREIGVAINASKLSTDLVAQYLEKYKFKNWIYHDGDKSREVTAKERKDRALDIANQLCDHSLWLSHANRITRQIVEERCRLEIIHPEEINGLERAIKRFWALMCYSFETTPLSKVFASSNYMLFHSQPERINRG
jgi:hypothetical protein